MMHLLCLYSWLQRPSGITIELVQREKAVSPCCISSLVVQTLPDMLPSVRKRLMAIPGTDVFAESGEGKLVVVIDAADNHKAADKITDIQNQAGVLSATLIYQYDDRFDSHVEGGI